MTRARESKHSPARLSSVLRQARAIELRKSGMTYRQIAESEMPPPDGVDPVAFKLRGLTLYNSPQAVANGIEAGLRRLLKLAGAEEVRELELVRLDRMLMGLWPRAISGDTDAIRGVLAIMSRRTKYLGLDAPVKVEATGPDGGPLKVEIDFKDDLIARISAIVARRGQGQLPPGPQG